MERKKRKDAGQPKPGSGNKHAAGVKGHSGKNAGRKKGNTLFIQPFALPEEDAAFVIDEQTRRGHSDPRQTIKDIIREKREMNTIVINKNGAKINYDAAVEMMDDDIRERLHSQMSPCSDQVFFTAYEQAHEQAHGEEFFLSGENPIY